MKTLLRIIAMTALTIFMLSLTECETRQTDDGRSVGKNETVTPKADLAKRDFCNHQIAILLG